MKTLIFAFMVSANFAVAVSFSITEMDVQLRIPKRAMLDDISLKQQSTGIRAKRKLFMNFDVYRATLLIPDDAVLVKNVEGEQALDSLRAMNGFALQLRLLCEVNAEDLVTGFNEALALNNAKAPELELFKNKLKSIGKLTKDYILTLAVTKKSKIVTCNYGTNSFELTDGSDKLIRDLFSIWFGRPSDANLGKLRTALIAPVVP